MVWFLALLLVMNIPAFLAKVLQPSKTVKVNPRKIRKARRWLFWDCLITTVIFIPYFIVVSLAGWASSDESYDVRDWLFEFDISIFWIVLVLLAPPWFKLMGYIMYLHRGERDKGGGGTLRAASLTPRPSVNPIGLFHWLAAWLGWLAVFALLIYFYAVGLNEDERMRALGLGMGIFIQIGLAGILICGPFMTRDVLLNEPEPLPPEGDEDLAEAYARHRRANAWMVYLGIMALLCVFYVFELSYVVGMTSTAHMNMIWGGVGFLFLLLCFLLVFLYIRRRKRLDRLMKACTGSEEF